MQKQIVKSGALAALAAISSWLLPACQSNPKELEKLSQSMLQASGGSASRTPMRTVVPSKPAAEAYVISIEDERYLGDLCRQLGVTVDDVMRVNNLKDGTLKKGMALQVTTTRDLVTQFEARREHKRQLRIAAEEAKRIAKVKADAEARALRKAKQREARQHKKELAKSGKHAAVVARSAHGKQGSKIALKLHGKSASKGPVHGKPVVAKALPAQRL